MRERVYKLAIGLSVFYVADGIMMAAVLMHPRSYAGLAYGQFVYLPLFVPAVLVGCVLVAVYAYQFFRRAWTLRRLEWAFILLFMLAVAAKLAVFLRRHWG